MKKIITKILHSLARRVLKKYKPKIVGITGSVGKTAAKEAVFAVLAGQARVRKNRGNFNTEISLPLTILGAPNPGRSVFGWLKVFRAGLRLLRKTADYPEILVLEMGADKPGDISELTAIAKPDAAVITRIAPAHTENFGSLAGVAKEKGQIFKAVDKAGFLVVNLDDKEVVDLAARAKAKKISVSLAADKGADIRAGEYAISYSNETPTGIAGISFKLIANGTVIPVLMRGVIGKHQIYPALFAAAIAKAFGRHMVEAAEGLSGIEPAPGRMRVLPGVKHTILIDDSYNSSPEAALAAIDAVRELARDGKTWLVLGDMLELGALSEKEHSRVGRAAAASGLEYLITVGERARDIARGAKAAGQPADRIFSFAKTAEAGLFVQGRMKEGDVVLIKGSRGMGMEVITKELMAEPERAHELLVY